MVEKTKISKVVKLVHSHGDGSTTDYEIELTDGRDGLYLKAGNEWIRIPLSMLESLSDSLREVAGSA